MWQPDVLQLDACACLVIRSSARALCLDFEHAVAMAYFKKA